VTAPACAVSLPLHDPSQWPVRMTVHEVAHVCRVSVRTVQRRVEAEAMPGPDRDGFFVRDEIARFLQGGVREFDKRRDRALRRAI
jgi:hypothetical protein